jgi:ATP-dependent DNA ligase
MKATRSLAAERHSFLSRVRWVEPKLVAEITYLTWTADGLLRHTVYVGPREDKPADHVRRGSYR